MKKIKGTNNTFTRGIILGAAVSIIISLVGSAIAAAAIHAQTIPQSSMQIVACIILLISSAVGCFAGGRVVGSKRALISGITAGTYLLVLIAITIVFFDGMFHNFWAGLACVAGGFVISCIICLKSNDGKYHRKRAIGKMHKKV